jgi:hypothetical protein
MSATKLDLGLPLAVVELLARVGSVASITLLLLLFQAEAFHPSEIAPKESIGLLFFPLGIVLGMALAWWKEGIGSAITLGSLAGFYVVYGYLLESHISGWAFVAFASPGFLFLIHWLFSNVGHKPVLRHTI